MLTIDQLLAELVDRMRHDRSFEECHKLFRKQLVVAELTFCKGNITRTARQLDVHRNTAIRFIREMDINVAEIRGDRSRRKGPHHIVMGSQGFECNGITR